MGGREEVGLLLQWAVEFLPHYGFGAGAARYKVVSLGYGYR